MRYALLFLLAVPAAPRETSRVLLITGKNNHDWEYSSPILKDILERTGKMTVDITTDPVKTLSDAEGLQKYQAFFLNYNNHMLGWYGADRNLDDEKRWGEPAQTNFLQAVKGGTGVVVFHAADNAFVGWEEYEKLVGDCWRQGTRHGTYHKFDVRVTDRHHPITKDLPDLKAHPDELYHNLIHTPGVEHRVLATAFSSLETKGSGREEPMIIVLQYGKGRVFHTPLGHVWKGKEETRVTLEDPQLHLLLARGTEWAATGDCTITSVPMK